MVQDSENYSLFDAFVPVVWDFIDFVPVVWDDVQLPDVWPDVQLPDVWDVPDFTVPFYLPLNIPKE